MADPELGKIVWFDLTVDAAEQIRDFYHAVFGWDHARHDMGDYADFSMKNAAGETVAGICHARGENAPLPPYWLPYVVVENLDEALTQVRNTGGTVVDERRHGEASGMATIQDPAGAYIALWQRPGGKDA